MDFRRPLALLLTLLLAALPISAQQSSATVYNVELIIFRVTNPIGAAENWSVQSLHSSQEFGESSGETPATAAASATQVGRFVRALPSSQYQLTEIANKLRASGAYVPVAHVAWSQTASAWGKQAGFTVQQLGIDVPGLTGTIFLERGQYLHLGMSLEYAMPNPPPGIGAGLGTVFTLNDSHRVRFYERHYYDHPAFGVIALVTPAQGDRPAGR